MEHNHPNFQNFTTYNINHKQSPEIMELVNCILSIGHKGPVANMMDVSLLYTIALNQFISHKK